MTKLCTDGLIYMRSNWKFLSLEAAAVTGLDL